MRKILTIIAAFVFGIQALMSIIDIFTIPTAGEIPTAGNIFLYVIDIEFTVFHIVFFTAGLCLSIAVLLPDKKPKSASLDISEQAQNITALKKKLAIIALVGFSLNLLCYLYYVFYEIWSYISFITEISFTDFLKNWVGNTFTNISIPIAGLCLTVAVLSPYKETKVAAADLGQQAQNIKGMKIKLAIIALVFCSISIVHFSYIEIVHFSYGSLLELLDGMLHSIPWVLPRISVLCLSIAVLLPYKKAAEISSANTAARRVKN